MHVKVLGLGCPKCHDTEAIIQKVFSELDPVSTVQRVCDLNEIMAYGVLSTPAVVIDDKVVCMGKVPSKSEIVAWIADFGARGDNDGVR